MANLGDLMRERGLSIRAVVQAAERRGITLTNGTVGRAVAGDAVMKLGTLGELARFFDLEAWQLLTPNLRGRYLVAESSKAYQEAIDQSINALRSLRDKKPDSGEDPVA